MHQEKMSMYSVETIFSPKKGHVLSTPQVVFLGGTATNVPSQQYSQSQYQPSFTTATTAASATHQQLKSNKSEESLDLDSVLKSISVQSDELLLGEELWRRRGQQKRLSESCLTASAKSKNIRNTVPTMSQAKAWSSEKEFWLNYIPRKALISEYTTQSGAPGEYWTPSSTRGKSIGEQNNNDEEQKLSVTQRCERYQKQMAFEQKVISEYDQRALNLQKSPKTGGRLSREKEKELAHTLNRYKSYGKALMNNLKDVQSDTKQMGDGLLRGNRRFQLEQMERLAEGYNNLKWIYELNPELVENLAKHHFSGPPPKKWMNLTRSEVNEVLILLKRGKDQTDFCPYTFLNISQTKKGASNNTMCRPPTLGCASRTFSSTEPQSKQDQRLPEMPVLDRSSFNTNRKPSKKSSRPLKPHQMMPIHIPGPDSLHQNVLIRAYTKEMDGREGDRKNKSQGHKGTKGKKSEDNKPGSGDNKEDISKVEAGVTRPTPTPREQVDETDNEEEAFTIESFVPFYSVTRT